MLATFFKVVSIDFLLQYSFEPPMPEIPNPNPPLGDIISTDSTNNNPATINKVTNIVYIICFYFEFKC